MDSQEREHCRLDLHKVTDVPGHLAMHGFITKWGRQLDEHLRDPDPTEEDAEALREAEKETAKAEKRAEELFAANALAVERLTSLAYSDDTSLNLQKALEAVITALEKAAEEPSA